MIPTLSPTARVTGMVVVSICGIFALDTFVHGHDILVIHGLADATAHVLTALIWIAALTALGIPVHWLAAVVGAVIVDVDHLLQFAGVFSAPEETSRIFTHSLAPVALLVLIGVLDRRRRRLWLSASLGVLSHLSRDIATGSVQLWWPLTSDRLGFVEWPSALEYVAIPYWIYALSLVALGLLAIVGTRRSTRYAHLADNTDHDTARAK